MKYEFGNSIIEVFKSSKSKKRRITKPSVETETNGAARIDDSTQDDDTRHKMLRSLIRIIRASIPIVDSAVNCYQCLLLYSVVSRPCCIAIRHCLHTYRMYVTYVRVHLHVWTDNCASYRLSRKKLPLCIIVVVWYWREQNMRSGKQVQRIVVEYGTRYNSSTNIIVYIPRIAFVQRCRNTTEFHLKNIIIRIIIDIEIIHGYEKLLNPVYRIQRKGHYP